MNLPRPGGILGANLGHPLNQHRLAWYLGLPDQMHPGGWADLRTPGRMVRRSGAIDRQVHGMPLGLTTPYFNGSSGYFYSTPTPFTWPTAAVTIGAWVFPNDTGGSRSIAGEYEGGGAKACLLHIAGAELQGYVTTNTGASNAFSAGTVSSNAWSYITMTWDGSTIRLYINGFADGSTARGGTMIRPTGFNIGHNTSTSAFYQGYVADVGVWSRALSQAEIREYILLSKNGYAGLLVEDGTFPPGAAGVSPLPADEYAWRDGIDNSAALKAHARRRRTAPPTVNAGYIIPAGTAEVIDMAKWYAPFALLRRQPRRALPTMPEFPLELLVFPEDPVAATLPTWNMAMTLPTPRPDQGFRPGSAEAATLWEGGFEVSLAVRVHRMMLAAGLLRLRY